MRLRAAVLPLLALTALGLLLPAARPAPAFAAGSLAFADAQRGWRLTLEDFVSPRRPGKAVLWRTADGGSTWKKVAARAPGLAGNAAVTPGLLAAGGPATALWGRTFWAGADLPWLRTTGGAGGWSAVANPAAGNLSGLGFATRKVAWACDYVGGSVAGGSVYRSADAGATWKRVLRVAPQPSVVPGDAFVAVAAPSASTCYVAGQGLLLGGLWRTADGGRHWDRRPLPGGRYVAAVAFPSEATGWAVVTSGAVFKTTDGGLSWTSQLAAGRHLTSVAFTDLQHGWVAGEDGALLRTADGGATWQLLDPGTDGWLRDLTFVDETHGWMTYADPFDVAAASLVLLRTADGGDTWVRP